MKKADILEAVYKAWEEKKNVVETIRLIDEFLEDLFITEFMEERAKEFKDWEEMNKALERYVEEKKKIYWSAILKYLAELIETELLK